MTSKDGVRDAVRMRKYERNKMRIINVFIDFTVLIRYVFRL